jgi:hypothetical protein
MVLHLPDRFFNPLFRGAIEARRMNFKQQAQLKKLVELVKEALADPDKAHAYGGFTWVAYRQPDMAEELAVSISTLRRLIQHPPLVRDRCSIDDKVWALLRVRTVGESVPVIEHKHAARIMEKIWREKTGRETCPAQFGLFMGIAQSWPQGEQVNIFRAALNDWPGFMVALKHVDMMAEIKAGKLASLHAKRHYSFPHLGAMREHPDAAVEFYGSKLQKEEKPLPPIIEALYMAA